MIYSFDKIISFIILVLYLETGIIGELFHTHNEISSQNAIFKDDIGCGITHHHTTFQKDDCLACVRANNPQSLSTSLSVRCFNAVEFVSLEYHATFLQTHFSSFGSRAPPHVSL